MSGQVIDLASRRVPDPLIRIYPNGREVIVRMEPPADRPGIHGGAFSTFGEARRYAQAMLILLPDRRIDICWTDPPETPAAA